MSPALPQFDELIRERMTLLRQLAESLETSQGALARNDAEAIARGAAHQAELCRRWSLLETQLRQQARPGSRPAAESPKTPSADVKQSVELQADWDALRVRIYHLTRVHWSLLRHLDRSLNMLRHIVDSCAPTYTPDPKLLQPAELALRPGD